MENQTMQGRGGVGRLGAVLFDLDGTLIDTEPLYADAGGELVEKWGGLWTRGRRERAVGMPLSDFVVMLQQAGVDESPEVITDLVLSRVDAMLGEKDVWREGARELVESVLASGVPTALVTMSYRATVERVLVSQGMPTFGVSVTGDEVSRSKPDPEAYLVASQKLGVPPAECVVLEDSVQGITAAHNAGMVCIAVPDNGVVQTDLYDEVWPELSSQQGAKGVDDVAAAFARASRGR
ncbi:HAD family hydrolase [Corynebacterium sp. AOP40-9SA-29]|uniref:HAD family hydrolase n=1 Tax=Corynebacterium sp. AOP40-9SA-29 TaxID=3457677 RepID=UPI0040345F45